MSGDELPDGWAEVAVGQVAEYVNGLAFRPSDWEATGRPIIRIQNLTDPSKPYNHTRREVAPRFIVTAGDILVSWSATLDAFRWNGPEAVLNQHIFRVVPRVALIDEDFLFWGLKVVIEEMWLSEHTHGSTMRHINRRPFLEHPFLLPPLQEQHRIVEEVEALLADVNAARDRLARVPLILKRFRQAVLAAACSGRLTEEWRDTHPKVVAATSIVESIRAVREKRKDVAGKLDDGEADLPDADLPVGWCWCRVADIATVCLGGTPSRKEPSYWGGLIPWVSSGEVANCRISATKERITNEGLLNSAAKVYPKGSVLIAMIGEGKTRGQSAILEIDACTNQNAAGLVFEPGTINPDYVWFWALGEYENTRDVGRGGNQPALNGRKVRALPVPLPPLAEQAEIVRRVEALFALADAIEARVKAATAKADKLPQAILSKAFKGELVTTEAELALAQGRSYETAEEMLARVKVGAEGEPTTGKRAAGAKARPARKMATT